MNKEGRSSRSVSTDPPIALGRRLSVADSVRLPLLALMTILAASTLIASRRWPLFTWDTVDFYYMALQVNKFHHLPYRDILEGDLGIVPFLAWFTSIFGYSAGAGRALDAVFVIALSGTTWALLSGTDWRVRWAAAAFYPLLYLGGGFYMTLQRDPLSILPAAVGLLALRRGPPSGPGSWVASVGAGAACALGALMKPWGIALLAPMALYQATRSEGPGPTPIARFARTAVLRFVVLGAGAAIPVAAMVLRMIHDENLSSYLYIATNVFPRHGHLLLDHKGVSGNLFFEFLSPAELWRHRVSTIQIRSSELIILAIAAFSVGRIATSRSKHRPEAYLFLACLALNALAQFMIGQWMPYSAQPMCYFASLLVAYLFLPETSNTGPEERFSWRLAWAPLLLVAVIYLPLTALRADLSFGSARPAEIEAFIRPKMHVGDKIQLLDCNGGGSIAALALQMELATKYWSDLTFQVKPTSPVDMALQDDLLSTLSRTPPRFILRTTDRRVFVRQRTPEDRAELAGFYARLDAFLDSLYLPEKQGDGYTIYVLRTDP
jgi:hypothetical protein